MDRYAIRVILHQGYLFRKKVKAEYDDGHWTSAALHLEIQLWSDDLK